MRWVRRSFATHASLFNTLSSNKLSKNSENPGTETQPNENPYKSVWPCHVMSREEVLLNHYLLYNKQLSFSINFWIYKLIIKKAQTLTKENAFIKKVILPQWRHHYVILILVDLVVCNQKLQQPTWFEH